MDSVPQFGKEITEPREGETSDLNTKKTNKNLNMQRILETQTSHMAHPPPSNDEIDIERTSLNVPDRLKFDFYGDGEEDNHLQADDDVMLEKKDADDQISYTTEAGKYKDFENWLIECGAEFPDLYLKRYTGDVRGVHSKCRVGPYVCLVQIPLKCLITDHMGRTETELGRKLFSSNYSLSTPNLIAVIIYILTTREEPDHFFQPYYKILPKDYNNFPIFWNEEELSWLEGSPLIDDIEERKRNMRADYDEVCRACPEFSRFSFEEFLEVRTAVGSRNFGIVVHGNKRTAMVPYADMLNHYRPRETSWTFEDSKNAFTITSLSSLRSGQQVMDSYGKKCNAKFLLHYGFAVECNREQDGKCQNEIYLRLALKDDDNLQEYRLAILGPSRKSRGFRLSMNIEDKATNEALSYCRVAVANKEELQTIMFRSGIIDSKTGVLINSDDRSTIGNRSYRDGSGYNSSNRNDQPSLGFVNTRNETAALEMLASYCQHQIELYSNTYAQNKKLLIEGNIPPFSTRRTALIVVTGEQEICDFWIGAYETLSEIFSREDKKPLHHVLRTLPRSTPNEADLARYAARVAYEIHISSK